MLALSVVSTSAFAAGKLWSAKLAGDAKWHSLTGLGTLSEGLYHFEKAKEGLTNLMVLPEQNSVLFADAAGHQGRRFVHFMLTKVEDGKAKGVGLLGINLANGEGERKFVLGTSEPEYRVDEAVNRLFFFKGKNSIVAY